MKYKLYTTSQKAWDGMIWELKKAKESIYLEMYIFSDDTKQTHDFLGLFKQKAREGVEIVMILDSYGSFSLKNNVVEELKELGIEVLYFNSWFRRTHRKILIIDNKVAFLGGVNIENKIRLWNDLQIKVSGKIVKPILKSFSRSYRKCGGKKSHILKYNNLLLPRKIKSWVADNWPNTTKRYYLNNYYKKKIKNASRSIQIVTPYLMPPKWLIIQLRKACQRGVKVEIIIPEHTDIKFLDRINYLNCCRLSAMGVNFYLLPKMNHAKVMLVDNEEGIIGSQNMDLLSFNFLAEVGVFFRQKQLVMDLKRIIEHWKNNSKVFNNQCRKLNFLDKTIMFIFKATYRIF